MRAFAILFLVALLAGCSSSPPPESTATPAQTPLPPPWALACPPQATYEREEGVCVGRVNDVASALVEPYLVQDPTDPEHYVMGVNELPLQALRGEMLRPGTAQLRLRLFDSVDGGAQWSDLPLPPIERVPGQAIANLSTGDPALAFAPDGTLHVAGMVSDHRLGFLEGSEQGIFHAETRDRGATWTTEILSTGPTDDRPWIAAGPDGSLVVTWHYFGVAASEEDDLGIVRVRPAGGAWSDPVHIARCVQPSLPLMREGNALLACRQTDFANNDFRMRLVSIDLSTAEWTTVFLAENDYFSFARIVEFADRLVALLPGSGETRSLLARISHDDGRTWSEPVDLALRVDAAAGFHHPDLKWAEAGPDGRLHVILGGGEQRRLTSEDPTAPEPRPYAYGAFDLPDLTPAASQLLYDGLADWPTDEPFRFAPLAYCCNDYQAIAFGDGKGLMAWSRDGAIDVTALVPPA